MNGRQETETTLGVKIIVVLVLVLVVGGAMFGIHHVKAATAVGESQVDLTDGVQNLAEFEESMENSLDE